MLLGLSAPARRGGVIALCLLAVALGSIAAIVLPQVISGHAPAELAWPALLAVALLLASARALQRAPSVSVDDVAGRLEWRHLQDAAVPSGTCSLESVTGVILAPSSMGDSIDGDVLLAIATLCHGQLPLRSFSTIGAVDRMAVIADALRQPRDALIDSAVMRMADEYRTDIATQSLFRLRNLDPRHLCPVSAARIEYRHVAPRRIDTERIVTADTSGKTTASR